MCKNKENSNKFKLTLEELFKDFTQEKQNVYLLLWGNNITEPFIVNSLEIQFQYVFDSIRYYSCSRISSKPPIHMTSQWPS